MADPTPPSDIPDPASPTPASPSPKSGLAAGPKRIRSMPDRPASARPTGSIRSVPEPTRGSGQMSGTYVETLSKEKSWGRGLAILWGLFLWMIVFEALNAACYLLAGRVGWPLPVDVARIAIVCTAFIALWSGLPWLRHVMVLVYALAGAWLLVDCTLSYRAYPQLMATGSANWAVYSTIESFPKIVVGLTCLTIAAYVLFSDDVREFIIHRRRQGRMGTALLSAIVVYGLMLLIFVAPLFYGKWMQAQYADVQRYGEETLRTAAEHWEVTAFDAKLDSAYAKNTFTKADRATTLGNFKALGPVKSIDPAPVVVRTPMPQYPLQDKYPIPQGVDSQVDSTRKGFELTAKYGPVDVNFEHGHGRFGFDLARPLSGQWRIMKLNVETVQYDARPKPAATPAPDASPAVDPSASPGASPAVVPPASPGASPAVAPSPVSSPAASLTPSAASPAASVAPVASPLASAAPVPAASPVAPAASPTP